MANQPLRELLETNIIALHALLEEQQRAVDTATRAIAALRADVRALTDQRAPWVKAISDTRALLFVALREVVTSNSPREAAQPQLR